MMMWAIAILFAIAVASMVVLSWSWWWVPAIILTAIIMAYKNIRVRQRKKV